jgi:hypothetical protein
VKDIRAEEDAMMTTFDNRFQDAVDVASGRVLPSVKPVG